MGSMNGVMMPVMILSFSYLILRQALQLIILFGGEQAGLGPGVCPGRRRGGRRGLGCALDDLVAGGRPVPLHGEGPLVEVGSPESAHPPG